MKRKLMILAGLFVLSAPSFGYVYGGSNLPILGYPSHDCSAPYSKPHEPYSFNSQWQVDQYNSEVRAYNDELEEYFSCIREYVENAENDLKRVRDAAQEAIHEANSL